MKLLEYIENNINEINAIHCYVNRKNKAEITDKNTVNVSNAHISAYKELEGVLLESEPVKVYLMDNETYNKAIYKNLYNENIPENRKDLLAIFTSDFEEKV